jgi:hypothetical protein
MAAPIDRPTLAETAQAVTRFWRGEYFNNTTLAGRPALIRNSSAIAFDWGHGSPSIRIRPDDFSVRWTRTLNFAGGSYRFQARMDDGARVFVDNQLVLDAWATGPARDVAVDLSLIGRHTVRVEYFERGDVARIRFEIVPLSLPATSPYWRGEYFSNPGLAGVPALVRGDAVINFDWGAGPPAFGIPADDFSARWVRTLDFAPGRYRFTVRVDDGVRIFVAGRLIIDGWVEGAPRNYSADADVSGPTEVRVEYFERGGGALIQFAVTNAPPTFTDWRGDYFNTIDLSGPPALVRNDGSINFDWGLGSPDPLIRSDGFSARWTRRQFFNPGQYRIDITVDDGMRVFVDNQLVLNEWYEAPPRSRVAFVTLTGGEHDLRVEYFESAGSAVARFNIMPEQPPTAAPPPVITPQP